MESAPPNPVTVRLDADLDPFRVGGRTGLLWHDGHLTLAGVGVSRRIPYRRNGVGVAASAVADLGSSDDAASAPPGVGPLAFAALPFDRDLAGELIVPQAVLASTADGRRWLTVIDPARRVDDVIDEVSTILAAARTTPEPASYRLDATLAPEIWRDEVVGFARDRILAGDLTKVVLARQLDLVTDHDIDVVAVTERLRSRFPAAMLFAVDGFVGASPELLVARSDDVVRAHPLAGTAPRAADPALDARASAGLLASDKDRWEHRITIDWLLDTLLPFCSYVDAEPEPSIVTLANVHHLGTRVEGRLSSPPASVLELVAALHPTPAVGGRPQAAALDLIEGLERADRGRYAGPVGWVDADGNGAFAVGVRTAEIRGNRARIFAGVGVVADSDPAAELAETRSKFQAMLDALIRP